MGIVTKNNQATTAQVRTEEHGWCRCVLHSKVGVDGVVAGQLIDHGDVGIFDVDRLRRLHQVKKETGRIARNWPTREPNLT